MYALAHPREQGRAYHGLRRPSRFGTVRAVGQPIRTLACWQPQVRGIEVRHGAPRSQRQLGDKLQGTYSQNSNIDKRFRRRRYGAKGSSSTVTISNTAKASSTAPAASSLPSGEDKAAAALKRIEKTSVGTGRRVRRRRRKKASEDLDVMNLTNG